LSSSAGNYGTVGDLVTAKLLDERFGSPSIVSGYTFDITASLSDYTATAIPTSANSGRYAYFTWPDAVVRYSAATDAALCGGPGGNCYPGSMSGQPVQ
jgi:hypothetical protein